MFSAVRAKKKNIFPFVSFAPVLRGGQVRTISNLIHRESFFFSGFFRDFFAEGGRVSFLCVCQNQMRLLNASSIDHFLRPSLVARSNS